MKKFLLCFSLVLVVAALVLCACVASDTSDTAQAYVQLRSNNWVVHPNLTGVDDFADASPSSLSRSDVVALGSSNVNGLYYNSNFYLSSTSPESDINSGATNSFYRMFSTVNTGVASPFSFYSIFNLPSNVNSGYISFNLMTYNTDSFTVWVYDFNNSYYRVNNSTVTNYGNLPYLQSVTLFVSGNFSNHRLLVYFEGVSPVTEFLLYGFKVEHFSSAPAAYPYFTGLVIPDYTYILPSTPDPDPEPEPSPFDGWDYVVRPNLLNGSDFYQYPYYFGDFSPEDSQLDPSNVWFTSLSTSSFTYNQPLSGDLVGSTSFNLPVVPSHGYFGYRYSPSEPSLGASNYTFSLCLRSPDVGGNVSLVSLGGYVNISSESFSASDDYQLITVTLLDVFLSDSLLIQIEFDDVSSAATVYFAFSKLEQGTLFTGYVPPEHDISYWVRDNFLTNYDFSSVPTTMTNPRVDNGVSNAWVSSYNFNFYYQNGGLVCDNTQNQSAAWLWYHLDNLGDLVGSNYCFTLDVSCDAGFYVEITDYYRYDSTYPNAPQGSHIQVAYYQVAPSSYSLSMVGEFYDDFYIFIRIPAGATMKLYAAKLEHGENFTGYCPSFSRYYFEGYDVGYNAGYAEGVEVFASDTFTLAFENVERPYAIDFGWADMGFSNVDSFLSSYFNLTSYFYEAKGFTVLSYGTAGIFDTTTGEHVGALIWISRDANVTSPNDATNYLYVAVREHGSNLVISDSEYPSSWNPVQYPNYRTVRLTVSRGMQDLLQTYGDASFNNGKNAGYTEGYSFGFEQGKAEGFTLANDVQSNRGWLGFFSAFVDVPVMVLTSLLDFDFFGFNLFSLVRILIFVSLFYLVIRLITKGKVSS